MKHFIAALGAVLVMTSVSVEAEDLVGIDALPAGDYVVDKSHASITWKVDHLGLAKYTARFTEFDADIVLDPKDPVKSSVVVTVNPLSVKTDYVKTEKKDFDAKLAKGESWFNGETFPSITFASKSIEKTGENTGVIHGELTLLGVTKPLVLNATFNGGYLRKPYSTVAALGISATATVKRSEWGFDTYVPSIGDEVEVLIEAEFHKKHEKILEQ